MKPEEAAQVLATFATTFQRTVDEQMMQLWYQSTLRQVDPDIAWSVVDVIVREDERFPTPARFNAVRRAEERRHDQPYAALPAPPRTETERERVAAIIARTRTTLQNAKTPEPKPRRTA